MQTYLLDLLQCPACREALEWQITAQEGDRIETAEATCPGCHGTYPVREGIGWFLMPDLPREDLWEELDSQLIQYLGRHLALKRKLLETPIEALNPADQFFRALVLEAEGRLDEAAAVEKLAHTGLYTVAYQTCWQNQVDFVIRRLGSGRGPVVDLASGRGYLVERLARELGRPIVTTDFSPQVLRRNRRWLENIGLYDRVSLLAFDVRRTPFRDKAVETLTTNLGLPNIEEPGGLLTELARITAGQFLAISHFYSSDDQANGQAIRQAHLEMLVYWDQTRRAFEGAGWRATLLNRCRGEARPTPVSAILDGAGIDGLPVAPTELEWGVLRAEPAKS
jgi:uncharacterized protein YbaR (Trm112 family)